MIDAGAELDLQDEEGKTALMWAAYVDNLERVRVLLLAGADVNLRDREGDNAWDETSDDAVEALLIAHGVVLDLGDTPPVIEPDEPEDDEEPSVD